MEYSVRFELGPDDWLRWGRQLFLKMNLWRILASLPLLGLIALIVGVLFATVDPIVSMLVFGFSSGVVLALFVNGAMAYAKIKQMALDMHKIVGDSSLCLTISDTQVELRSSFGTRCVPWHHVTRVLSTRDFLTLFTGIILVASFPRSCLSEEAKEYLENVTSRR